MRASECVLPLTVGDRLASRCALHVISTATTTPVVLTMAASATQSTKRPWLCGKFRTISPCSSVHSRVSAAATSASTHGPRQRRPSVAQLHRFVKRATWEKPHTSVKRASRGAGSTRIVRSRGGRQQPLTSAAPHAVARVTKRACPSDPSSDVAARKKRARMRTRMYTPW